MYMSTPLHIPVFNKFELDLPAWFAVPNKNFGDPKKPVWWHLANPTTTARNISNRQHEHAIDIRRRVVDTPQIRVNQWDLSKDLPEDYEDTITLEHFNDLDKARIAKMQQHRGAVFANYPVLARGRPEALEKNVIYNRHHNRHDRVQKYGEPYLRKVAEVSVGKPILAGENYEHHFDRADHPSPQSSRTSATSRTLSRLSSLASSLRSGSSRGSQGGFEPANQSESDSESDDEGEARRQADRNVFRPNASTRSGSSRSGSSRSGSSKSGSSRSGSSSTSRGKPPLRRKAQNPTLTTKALERAEKKRQKEQEKEDKKKAREEAKEARDKEKADKAQAPKTKGTTRWAKPTSSQGDEPLVQKARGRKPKYATKEEAYQAKLEQNKIGKQKKAEAKRKAKEDAENATGGTGISLTIEPVKEPVKEKTQDERRKEMEDKERDKYLSALAVKTEKLAEKEKKRLEKKQVADMKKANKPVAKPRGRPKKKKDTKE